MWEQNEPNKTILERLTCQHALDFQNHHLGSVELQARPRFIGYFDYSLGSARVRRVPLPEIVLWTTALRYPSESQTPECSDLLSRSRATFVIMAQRQPGKLIWTSA